MSEPVYAMTSKSAGGRFRTVPRHYRRLAGLAGAAVIASAVPGAAFADASGASSTTIVSPTNNAISSSVSRDGSRWVHVIDGAAAYGLPRYTLEDVSTPTLGGPDVLESRDASGAPAPGANAWGVLSTDGRKFAWMTTGTGLVPGVTDRNTGWDVYVRDRGTGAVAAVSVRADGTTGDRGDELRGASADLRYLVLQSYDTDLVAGQNPDPQASESVVLADTVQGTRELVSVTPAGTAGNSWAGDPRVSDDGRYVLFISNATNLTDDGAYPGASIFLRDRQTRTTRRLDHPPGAIAGPNASCSDPSLSGDGRFAAFTCSGGVILAPGAGGSGADLYVVDIATGAIRLISASASYPHLSGTGRFLSYNAPGSQAPQVPCSGSTAPCAGYVYLTDLASDTTSVVSVDAAGRGLLASAGTAPAVSDDGRYVTFSVSLSQYSGWTEALRDRGAAAAIPVAVPPSPPTGVTVTSGNHSATITWLKPASDGGSAILGYTVTASPGGQSCSTAGADILTCTITGLTNGVNYTFTVTARNAAGSGAPVTTPPDEPVVVGLPPAPVDVLPPEPDPANGTRVTLRWLAAQSDPNLPIVGYRATAEPGGHACTTTGALFCTITGLTPGQDYTFTVVAINGAGPSGPSDPVAYDPAADLLVAVAAPAGQAALGDAFTATMTVTNTGPAPSPQATATFTLGGASATALTATTAAGGCTIAGATVTCALGSLPAGATATLVVAVEPTAVGTVTLVAAATGSAPDPVTANNSAAQTVTVTNPHGCTILGTPGNDVINGTNANDVICAFGGDDRVTAGNGDDVIYGGTGADTLDGGNGNDTIYAGPGGSVLIGGNGNDTITGGIGNDTIYGDNGNDVINAGAGNDTIYGGNGNDTIDAGEGNDTVDGGNGTDTCTHTETGANCTG